MKKAKKVWQNESKCRKKINFDEVKKTPSKKPKKKPRLKINLSLEEALKTAFSPKNNSNKK